MEETAFLAIAEKKKNGHRKGGCINILFDFFEWNRNFSKSNLFSKKLLLPAGEEQVSTRFVKNEKMPKPMIHMISDGYTRSFLNVNKKRKKNNNEGSGIIEQEQGMKSPGLVARLMGLESMPEKSEENLNKASLIYRREEKPSDDDTNAKLESRLQKAPNKHHQKFPSRLQSPCALNTRDCNSLKASRLINVATRILDPGLQAKNKAKYSLTYPHRAVSELTSPDSRKQRLRSAHLGRKQCTCPVSAADHTRFPSFQFPERYAGKPNSISSYDNVERNPAQLNELVSKRNSMANMECTSQSRRVSPSSRATASGEAGNFTSDQGLSSKNDVRSLPNRSGSSKFDLERRFFVRRDDSLSPSSRFAVKKKGDVSGNGHFQSRDSAVASLFKKENGKSRNGFEREDTKHRARNQQSSSGVTSSSASGGDRTRGTEESRETSRTADEESENLSVDRQAPLNGDALGAVLEQTLKELTYEGEDKLKKPTAMILQELISALTAEQLVNQKECLNDTEIAFQAASKNQGSSVSCACADGADRSSPGCVHEALFSKSCVPGELENSSGYAIQPEADVQDSASLIKKSHFIGCHMATDLADCYSQVMISINEMGLGLKGSELKHAEDVVLHTELLFRDTREYASGPSLLDQLMILDKQKWRTRNWLPGFKVIKENDQFNRRFFFNSMVECLESKYCMYGDFGFKRWRHMLLPRNVALLVREEISIWMNLAGMGTDEIVKREMNSSLGKWKDFEAGVFEVAVEIGLDILQDLVEEFVKEL